MHASGRQDVALTTLSSSSRHLDIAPGRISSRVPLDVLGISQDRPLARVRRFPSDVSTVRQSQPGRNRSRRSSSSYRLSTSKTPARIVCRYRWTLTATPTLQNIYEFLPHDPSQTRRQAFNREGKPGQ